MTSDDDSITNIGHSDRVAAIAVVACALALAVGMVVGAWLWRLWHG